MTIDTEADIDELEETFGWSTAPEIVVLDAAGRAWILIETEDGLYAWGSWWEDDGDKHTSRPAYELQRPLTVLAPALSAYDDRMPIIDILAKVELVHPVDLALVDDGHGQFPDSYELTAAGRRLIAEAIENR